MSSQEIYSYKIKTAKKKEHILMAYLNNKTGVLNKVVSLFRRRRFNILSLTTGPSEKPNIYRLTFTVDGENTDVNQVLHQMQKLIDVIHVEDVTSKKRITHELALIIIKIGSTKTAQEKFEKLITEYKAKIVHHYDHTVIVELTGKAASIDKFILSSQQHSFKVLEISRTGVTSINK